MKNSFLMEKLLDLQYEYKDLLEGLLPELYKDEFRFIVEEINLFWYSKRKLVELILNNISENFDTFLFTGATYLDVKNREHYPFVSLGKNHVVDDPLAKFAEVILLNEDEQFFFMIRKQMILAFEDDLNVLSECFGKIYLLPVTLLQKLQDGLISKSTTQIFQSMFKEEENLEQIFKRFRTLPDLIGALREGIKENLIFLEDEDMTQDISIRFAHYLKEMEQPFGCIPEVQKFVYTIMGFLSQSLQILMSAAQYRMIPYVRYKVTYRYLFVLSHNFLDIPDMKLLIYKASFAYLFYKNYDLEKASKQLFSSYCEKIDKIDIIKMLEEKTQENYDFTLDTFSDLNKFVDEILDGVC